MKIAKQNKEYVEIDETSLKTYSQKEKVHLLKICLKSPNKSILDEIISRFSATNRFIIDDYVKFYNSYFKEIGKKYYVENKKGDKLLTFARRNNKICWNFTVLDQIEMKWAANNIEDILTNAEVVVTTELFYISNAEIFNAWPGNLIIVEDSND